MRKIRCEKCGIDRKMIIRATKLRVQADKNITEYTLRNLCVRCFTETIGLQGHFENGKYIIRNMEKCA